jgi:hypothetical protein
VLLAVGTRATVRNSIVYGFPGYWADVVGATTSALATSGEVTITNTIFFDPATRANPGFPGGDVEVGGEDDDVGLSEDARFRTPSLQNRFPTTGFMLVAPFEAPDSRPDWSAPGFIDTGTVADTAPVGWETVWETGQFYAGALPRISTPADRARDWSTGWTSFPAD